MKTITMIIRYTDQMKITVDRIISLFPCFVYFKDIELKDYVKLKVKCRVEDASRIEERLHACFC